MLSPPLLKALLIFVNCIEYKLASQVYFPQLTLLFEVYLYFIWCSALYSDELLLRKVFSTSCILFRWIMSYIPPITNKNRLFQVFFIRWKREANYLQCWWVNQIVSCFVLFRILVEDYPTKDHSSAQFIF